MANNVDPKLIEYLNQLYEGVLPKDFIELFKVALFHVPPTVHNHSEEILKTILNAKQLTIGQVGICQGVIRSCPPNFLYQDLNHYFHINGQIEKIADKYKSELFLKQREIDNERRTRQSIYSGNNNLHKI